MSEIQNFDDLSETAKWLICRMTGDKDVWPEGGTPDWQISIGGTKVDPTEFFDVVGEAIERKSEEGALARFADLLGAFTDDVENIHSEFRENVRAILRDSRE